MKLGVRSTLLCLACQLVFVSLAAGQGDAPLAEREETALRDAAQNVADSVVQIRTIGGLDSLTGALSAAGPTTGLVISPDGYVLSSAFNFSEPPASILVAFANGKQVPAELVATDHSRMLVLLKVTVDNELSVPEFAPADGIRPGQWAVAVGRTFQLDRTNLAVGIVSAVGRMYGKVIQTDAAISMANYGGPLVDIHGRVLGVIVPMAGQGTSGMAGVEWYDSGIGFAVPVDQIADRIELMKKGEDQRPGILGIGMLPKNPHEAPAELAAVRPDSPAAQAGLKKGDRIIEIEGKPIRTQTDLRFALGPRYGGESVQVVAMRGDRRLESTIELAGELPAFRHAYLGILPMRSDPPTNHAEPESQGEAEPPDSDSAPASDDESATETDNEQRDPTGIAVRMVCDATPALEAGVVAGDRILRINDSPIDSIDDALEAMNNVAPGDAVTLLRDRNGDVAELKIPAARLTPSIPSSLPPAVPIAADNKPQTDSSGEIVDLLLPEFPHKCQAYIPASHAAGRPQALLLWLQQVAGEADAQQVFRKWKPICERDGVILVLPVAAETGRWERTEAQYLRRLMERVLGNYKIDRRRVVVYGQQGGGAMAWLLGFAGREVFRGIAVVDAPLPRQLNVPQNEPATRLGIFVAVPPGSEAAAAQINEGLQKLADAGYTVSTATSESDQLTDSQREELAHWLDTLDRF